MNSSIYKKINNINNLLSAKVQNNISNTNPQITSLNYIANAFDYLTYNLNYDYKNIKKYNAIKNSEKQNEMYSKLFSLKKCILKGVGICNQFSDYLLLLIANNNNLLAKKFASEIKSSNFYFHLKKPYGQIDYHSINYFEIFNKPYFCDVTIGNKMLQSNYNAREFCLLTEEQLHKAYKKYTLSEFSGTGDILEIKPNSIENLYNMLDHGVFYKSNNSENYKIYKYVIK